MIKTMCDSKFIGLSFNGLNCLVSYIRIAFTNIRGSVMRRNKLKAM